MHGALDSKKERSDIALKDFILLEILSL